MLGLGGLYKRSAAARAARARMTRLSSTFELRSSTQLSDWDCELVKYVHKPTGCEVYSAHTSDNNKTFGAMFRTPPLRNTGAAHIVEHCVLCGGEKYSARDPFLHMLKSSLQTFLNAMTYSDRTVYPVASTNVTDIYNLADVYCDAVLRPKLQEFSFMQEGWRLQSKKQLLQSNYQIFLSFSFLWVHGSHLIPMLQMMAKMAQIACTEWFTTK